jgi:hypothetical protein|tara:strand:- start:71 stop:355 length:285 start_codon:yes stop_codon:yes gene_type:complete
MGFDDNLFKDKDGSYRLASKAKKVKKGICLTCGEDSTTRDLLYEYNTDDMLLVREYIEDHLITYSNHKSMKAIWCNECKALIEYKVILDDKKSN